MLPGAKYGNPAWAAARVVHVLWAAPGARSVRVEVIITIITDAVIDLLRRGNALFVLELLNLQ